MWNCAKGPKEEYEWLSSDNFVRSQNLDCFQSVGLPNKFKKALNSAIFAEQTKEWEIQKELLWPNLRWILDSGQQILPDGCLPQQDNPLKLFPQIHLKQHGSAAQTATVSSHKRPCIFSLELRKLVLRHVSLFVWMDEQLQWSVSTRRGFTQMFHLQPDF